jgi:sn-glycerol 3-phosphate transport system permease protein
VVRGIWLYRSLLIFALRGRACGGRVLWLFLFSPSVGLVAYVLDKCGISWNILLNSHHAMTLIVIALGLEANLLQLLVLFSRLSKHPQILGRSCGYRWR